MFKLFIAISTLSFFVHAQDMKCNYDNALIFLETIVGDSGNHTPKEINNCINQNVEHLKNSYGKRFVDTGDAIVILPKREGQKAIAWKYSEPGSASGWDAEKVYIKKSFLSGGNWTSQSGGQRLRDHELVNKAIEDLGIDPNSIRWKRDRKDVYIDSGEGSQCQRKRCGRRSSWDPISCQCVDRVCEDVETKEKACTDQNQSGVHKYEVEFTYSFNKQLCKCNKEKNDTFIPPRKRSCAPSTVEYVQKQKDCAAKTDPDTGVSFELNDDCKCERTRTFCNGEMTKAEYKDEKQACKEAGGELIDCKCVTDSGDKKCRYKEKRKFAGDLFSKIMNFNGSDKTQEHFANETPPRYGPCDMEDWLKTVGSPSKNVENCKDYEKLKIKKRGSEDGDNFTTKRFLCNKCKSGFDPVMTETSIDGVNDDWMEQSHMSYISKCVESNNKCEGRRFEKRKRKCKDKNKIQKYIDRGITFDWNPETCKCDKEKSDDEDDTDTDEVPKVCMDKVSQHEIRRCLKADGVFDENTCECDAPCYEVLGQEEVYDTGETSCRYDGTEVAGDPVVELLSEEVTDPVEEGSCDEVVGGREHKEKIKLLEEKCKEQMAQEAQEGVKSKSVTLDIKLSDQVNCSITRKFEGAGFADKIPGLVGGLDLDKDFVDSNGNKLNIPDGIVDANDFCSKNKIKYKPQENQYDGKFKSTNLNDSQCKDVVEIYNGVKKKAIDFVSAIESENLTSDQKAELLANGFNSTVTASANRVPHSSGYVNHNQLSEKRANSMNAFYKEEVINSIKDPQLKQKVSEQLAGHDGVSNNISYFGPQYVSSSSSIAKWAPEADPSAQECMQYVNLTENEKKVPKSQANEKILAEMRKYYDCTIDYHVNHEIENLRAKSDVYNTNTDENFALAIKQNPIFLGYALNNDIQVADFDIYNNKEVYADFLKSMFDRSTENQKELLNSMKIFDIDVSAGGGLNYTQEVNSDIQVKCEVNYQDLYQEDPILQTVDVMYGKRPSFFRRMNGQCREQHKKLIDDLQDKVAQQNLALKDELVDRFGPERGLKKFNRKMRRKARKEWRKSKRNTRQVRKDNNGSTGWARENRDNDNGDTFNSIKDGSIDTGDLREYKETTLTPEEVEEVNQNQ
jgi:hypothetical protein